MPAEWPDSVSTPLNCMSNRDSLSKDFARKMGLKSRAATRHDVDDREAMKLYRRGLSDLNIADLMGVSKGDVYRWRMEKGLPSNMRKRKGGRK